MITSGSRAGCGRDQILQTGSDRHLFRETRLIHVERSAIQRFAVEGIDRAVCIGRVAHFHESEPARLTAVAVTNDACPFNCTELAEGRGKIAVRGLVGQVAYE